MATLKELQDDLKKREKNLKENQKDLTKYRERLKELRELKDDLKKFLEPSRLWSSFATGVFAYARRSAFSTVENEMQYARNVVRIAQRNIVALKEGIKTITKDIKNEKTRLAAEKKAQKEKPETPKQEAPNE